ncbi:MAG: RHS repeat-associated core domain-containing protein [Acidobacteriota bacterium]
MYVVHGELRLTQGGQLIRSWLEIRKARPDPNGELRLQFQWAWDGTDALGRPVGDGAKNWTFRAKFRGATDTESGVVGVDRLPPTISIEQPEEGQITGASVAVSVTWSDALSGIDVSTASATLDGSPVSGLTIDGSGAHGTLEGVAGGPHTLGASVADFAGHKVTATRDFVTDRTAPVLTINQPGGQISGSTVPVDITWQDSPAGIDATTGVVELDGSPTSGLTIDEAGARGTLEGVTGGPHSLSASVRDQVGNEASASSGFEVTTGQPGVQKTSIVGTVADSTGAQLAGVEVWSPAASQAVTTDAAGRFLIEMTSAGTHWLTFEKEGWIPVQRPAPVPEGQHFNIGEVRVVAADPQITTIGPAGGTATDSSGDVELIVPPGALPEAVEIRLTHIPTSKELPGPLNASDNVQFPISYTFCVYLEPYGTAFSQAVTLRYPNRWGFAAGHRIPTALWDQSANKWIPDGGHMIVSQDGATIQSQLTSFSLPGQRSTLARTARGVEQQEPPKGVARDANAGNGGPGTGAKPGQAKPPDPCQSKGSIVRVASSSYSKSVSLPATTCLGSNTALSFTYRSETASPHALVRTATWFGPEASTMLNWRYSVYVNGRRSDVIFQPLTENQILNYVWDGRNGLGDLSPTGLYTYRAEVGARYDGYYTNEETWGGMPTGLISARSGEPVEKRFLLEDELALVNGVDSPFGSGWHLSGVPRLFLQNDGKVLVVEDGSPGTVYYPWINYARISEGASVAGVRNEGYPGQGDKRNMIGYHGTGAKFAGVPEEIDYRDSFMFNSSSGPYDWVVLDLGEEREIDTIGLSFKVALTPNAIVSAPIIRIYTSLDNQNWSLWSEAFEETLENAMPRKLSSPYLATHASPETARYVKYEVQPPFERGVSAQTLIYRLYAFGASDRYGTGENGQEEDYPRLRRLQAGGWEQTERDGTAWVYDQAGLLQSIADSHGNTTIYGWTDGLLTRITDPAGGFTTLDYASGKLSAVTDAAGRTTTFGINGSGDLTSVQLPDGSVTHFAYDGRHLIQSVTDPRESVTSYVWHQAYPRLLEIHKPGGSEVQLDPAYFHNLINGMSGTEQSPAPPVPVVPSESVLTDELGRQTSYKWQIYENETSGNTVYLETVRDAAGRETKRYLHPRMESQELLRIEPDGSRMRNTYDADEGRYALMVRDLSEPTCGSWCPQYDYQIKAEYTYEPVFKQVATSTDMGQHTTSYAYNSYGDLVSTTDPLGHATTMTYDSKGRLETVTDAAGAVTRYEHDSRGNRTKTIDPLGRETAMWYDAAGNMTSLIDPAGKMTRWEYDQVGRVTKVIDPAGGRTSYVYEPSCCSGCGGGGSSGLLKSITDPAGHTTTFEYDPAGRMTAVVNPLGTRKEYTYDLAGRLVKFKNGRGQEISYQYDVSNNLLKKTLPDEGDVDYAYNVNNQLTQVTDADSILRYEYATQTGGWLLKGQKSREWFGVKGDPRYEKQSSGSIVYEYRGDESGHRWEFLGNVFMRADLPDGRVTNWGIDMKWNGGHQLANLMAHSGNAAGSAFTYDPAGRRTQMAIQMFGGGTWAETNYQYDLAGQLLQLSHGTRGGPTLRTYSYSYDQAGNRTSMVDNQGAHGYGYDDKYQLSTATHPIDPAESFQYDPVGNRTSSHISPSYTYNAANQLLEDAEFTYSYDLDGNCVGKLNKLTGERHEYIFDSENRMTGYRKYDIQGPVTTADYSYDAVGRRIAKSVNGVLTRFLYHEEDVWMQLRADGWPERYYFHGPGIDEPLWTWQGEFTDSHFYMPDALGTIRDMRNYTWTGNPIVASFTYDSFGQITSSTPPPGAPDIYRYTGREWDPESGLYAFRSRFYDPHTGRFLAEDPFGFMADENFYRYVTNNPVTFNDPFGLAGTVAAGATIGSACGPWGTAIGSAIGLIAGIIIGEEIAEHCKPREECPKKKGDKWMCEGPAKYELIGQNKSVVWGGWIVAYGNSETAARYNWIRAAQAAAPRGTTARHVYPRKCTKIR